MNVLDGSTGLGSDSSRSDHLPSNSWPHWVVGFQRQRPAGTAVTVGLDQPQPHAKSGRGSIQGESQKEPGVLNDLSKGIEQRIILRYLRMVTLCKTSRELNYL